MDAKQKIPVSVIIPTIGKNKRFLKEALNSIQESSKLPQETIIIDDSGNNIIEKWDLKNYNCLSIKIISNKENLGSCKTRNVGVNACKTKYITFLDDDDMFTPLRLELLYDFLTTNKEYSLVGSANIILNEKNKLSVKENKKLNRTITLNDISKANYLGASVLTETKKILDIYGFDENLVASQDHDIWLRLIKKHGPGFKLKEALYVSRQHNSYHRVSKNVLVGMTQFYNKHKANMSLTQKFIFRLRIIKHKIR